MVYKVVSVLSSVIQKSSTIGVDAAFLDLSECDVIHRLAKDDRVSRTSGVPPECDLDTVKRWANTNLESHPTEQVYRIKNQNDEIIGCGILKKIKYRDDGRPVSAEISYWIGSDYWGRGYGTAITDLLVTFCRKNGCDFVHSHYLKKSNPASDRILEKVGFKPWYEKEDYPVEGRFAAAFPGDVWTFMRMDFH